VRIMLSRKLASETHVTPREAWKVTIDYQDALSDSSFLCADPDAGLAGWRGWRDWRGGGAGFGWLLVPAVLID